MTDMFFEQGFWWPTGIKPTAIPHAFRHARYMEPVFSFLEHKRVAVQAGGNIGLWPLRFAKAFDLVHTFEPEPLLYECLYKNTRDVKNIVRHHSALGEMCGSCAMNRKSLGSHTVIEGDEVVVLPIDYFGLPYLDLLQLDLEGYEAKAIRGALATIKRCKPVIQLEWRGFTKNYGDDPDDLFRFLTGDLGYVKVADLKGSDILLKHGSQL